jgi:N-acetylglucosaminyl-diphospho-decaprenol L-rhamnosyltransferase
MKDVELILVSYHSAAQIAGLLDGLPTDLPVAVVDNARDADGVSGIVRARPHARYMDSGGGKGYAKAANLGARTSSREFVVFGNPDSRPTATVIESLVDHLRRDPTCGSVSATTVDQKGRPELGVGGWEPTLRRIFVHAFGLHKFLPAAGVWYPPEDTQAVQREWVSGACMAIRRDTFVGLGGFDERYFLYNEDMSFGRRMREAGQRQIIRGDLRVPHLGGGSGAGSSYSSYMSRMRGASMIAYLRQHHRPGVVLVMRSALIIGYLLRIVECLVTRRWKRARGFIAYERGLILGRGALV